MPQWGTSTTLEIKPNWLTADELERCYATNAGWVLKHLDGTEEVLVSVRSLDTRLGAPTITKVAFTAGSYTEGNTRNVKLTYNEKVVVTGTPTLTITDSVVGDVTATFTGISSNGLVLTFAFQVPVGGETLSIGAQNLGVAGATIKEAKDPGTLDAQVSISEAVGAAAGTKSVLPAPYISGVSFPDTYYVETGVRTVAVEYNEAVTVTGAPTLVVTDSVAGPVTATYASSNLAGTILTFEFTVPTVGGDLSIGTQTIGVVDATVKETKAPQEAAALLTISADVATAAGTETVLAKPTISGVAFAAGDYVEATTNVVEVTYSEAVTITGTPTLDVTDADAVDPIVATYTGSNEAGTVLTFSFTVPAATHTLSIEAQSLVITDASIKETKVPGDVNADLAISAGQGTAAGTKVVVVA